MTHSKQDCPFEEKINRTHEIVQVNQEKIDNIKNKEWYDNQQIYEKMMDGFDNFNEKFKEFNKNFEKYNGLKEKQQEVTKIALQNKKAVRELAQKKAEEEKAEETKTDIYDNWRVWLGWLIAFILSAYKIADIFG